MAESIDATRKDLDFALWAYVFMPEHVHMVIYPRREEYDVSVILQRIKEPVGRKAVKFLQDSAPEWLPRISVVRGGRVERRFWQAGGGYDRNVAELKALLAMIDYTHQNPVRRGLVSHAVEWKWSSAGWFEGKGRNLLPVDKIDVDSVGALLG